DVRDAFFGEPIVDRFGHPPCHTAHTEGLIDIEMSPVTDAFSAKIFRCQLDGTARETDHTAFRLCDHHAAETLQPVPKTVEPDARTIGRKLDQHAVPVHHAVKILEHREQLLQTGI